MINKVLSMTIPLLIILPLSIIPCYGQEFSWVATKGPEGGSIVSITAVGEALFVKPEMSPVYRSLNGGTSWEAINTVPRNWGGYLYNHKNSIYYVQLDNSATPNLWQSADNGSNWNYLGKVEGSSDRAFAFYESDIYAGGCGRIYKKNNDNTWPFIESEDIKNNCISLLAVNGSRIYAGMDTKGLYFSENFGTNWQEVLDLKDEVVTALAISPWGTVFVGVRGRYTDDEKDWFDPRVFYTTDGSSWGFSYVGAHWSAIFKNFVFDADKRTVYVGDEGVYKSIDDGKNWINLNAPSWASFLTLDHQGNIFCGNRGIGVYKYLPDSSQWVASNTGMVATEIGDVLIDGQGRLFATSMRGGGGIYLSQDKGETWKQVLLVNPWAGVANLAMNSAGNIFGGNYFAYSIDGESWKFVGLPYYVYVDKKDNLYLYGRGGIWKFAGQNIYDLEEFPNSYNFLGLADEDIYRMAVNSRGVLFAVTFGFPIKMWRSTNSGQTWTRIDNDVFFSDRLSGDATPFIIGSDDTIFMATWNEKKYSVMIYRSKDNGDRWETLPYIEANSLAANEAGQVFAIPNAFSNDGGNSWIELSSMQKLTYRAFAMTFDKEGYAYAGTWGGGVWRTTAPTYDFQSVAIDIKPGDDENTIKLGSKGVVPVAILSSETFDATTVDPMSVTLAGATVRVRGKGTPMASLIDVNSDGRIDLLVHVETEALELTPENKVTILFGKTYSGRKIKGVDRIRVIF